MNRLLIDCVNDRAGVQNRYMSVADLMNFIHRTGRIKNFTVWAKKGERAICIETEDPFDLEKRLNDFNKLP
jgi:hypothetical protein